MIKDKIIYEINDVKRLFGKTKSTMLFTITKGISLNGGL